MKFQCFKFGEHRLVTRSLLRREHQKLSVDTKLSKRKTLGVKTDLFLTRVF